MQNHEFAKHLMREQNTIYSTITLFVLKLMLQQAYGQYIVYQ